MYSSLRFKIINVLVFLFPFFAPIWLFMAFLEPSTFSTTSRNATLPHHTCPKNHAENPNPPSTL